MSLVQIVDENDELIGYKERTEVDYARDIYRSSCIWIENSKGSVLLAQRSLDKDKDPGMWGPAAAGTVEKGETYESNAYKETEEEIGVGNIRLVPAIKILEENPRRHFIQAYFAKLDLPIEEFKIQKEEVEQIAWIPKQDLASDFSQHPEKYVPSMPEWIKAFIEKV